MVNICVLDCSYAPEGDKHKMAKLWGHINIVTMKWFDESIAQRGNFHDLRLYVVVPFGF